MAKLTTSGCSQLTQDVFARKQGKIVDGSTPSWSIGEYEKLAETVRLPKLNGANTYRFSISWTRILPGGVAGTGKRWCIITNY
jgi:beta-glucosidase